MPDNIFRKNNCIGKDKAQNEVEIPHNIVFVSVKTQQARHPNIEDCVEESTTEGFMYCTKCGLRLESTIDFSDD